MTTQPTTLDELFDFLKTNPTAEDAISLGLPVAHGELDWTSLPTFGGDEPSDTSEVWSWDEDRLIVGTGANNIEIMERDEWQAR